MTPRFMAGESGWLMVPFFVMGNRVEQTLENREFNWGHVEV